MVSGAMPPSQLLRKFASCPRQHDLAVALREIGRVERTLFMIDWLLDVDMQRRAGFGLHKGEAHRALKSSLRIGDRERSGPDVRSPALPDRGLNLLTAIITCWNSDRLGHAVRERKRECIEMPDASQARLALGWEHILLTGEHRWPRMPNPIA